MKRIAMVLGLSCMIASAAQAQNGYIRMPLNISFYKDYSLGHMIGGNRRIINHLSFTLLTGRAARLQGIEVGGLSNTYSESVHGIQVAGLANAVNGRSVAIQIAGLANVVNDDFTGIQGAGLANVVSGGMAGAQVSVLANVTEREFGGLQLGGLANISGDDGWGLQGAGLANVVSGGMTGVQVSGLVNVIEKHFTGAQGAGLVNVVDGDMRGLQGAGLVNVVNGNLTGAQFAGLVNVAEGDAEVIQTSTLVNVIEGHLSGIQIAGLVNVADNGMDGIQVSGLVNVADSGFAGVQATGLVNVGGDVRGGLQTAGLMNVMDGSRYVIQTAGLLNVAENPHRSVLVAPINAADNTDILPLGLVSLVTGVPTWYDVWAEASGFVNVGFRSGTDRIHNFVFTGLRPGDPYRWAIGWGIGGHSDMGDKYYLEADASVRHINVDEFWTGGRNTQATFRVLGGWRLTDTVSLYGGPTFDYYTSTIEDGSDIASWSTSDSRDGGTWTRTWPGIAVGIRFERGVTDTADILENLFDFEDVFSF